MAKLLWIAGTAVLASGFVAAPTVAQDRPIARIVVFGDDPCPRSTDDEIVVCARKDESERFRIPEQLRDNSDRQANQSWAARAQYLETHNSTGMRQCSPVGPGGFVGCMQEMISSNDERREEIDEVNKVPED
ncbi:hypothetical protein [Sphingomicrobium clamense]|uniref:Secreted protein n=1 Tax=Sphingomicrobium clamense TaxID=2851013 RepID=A0ABS6V415_9SPHN|nr:hypothetical protein [Sphingomicrobium sp. B8]MBW0144288.1 hypothetical protein [Sphingomicrobium sp. B8]